MTSDVDSIVRLMARFAQGIDLRDWSLYRSVFTEQIDIDYTSYRPGSEGRFRADDWVDRGRMLFPGLSASQHFLSNFDIAVDSAEGTGRVVAYVRAEHVLPNPAGDAVFTIGGFYSDDVVRVDDGWRICAKRLTVLWNTGNPQVLTLARERAAELARRPGDDG
ncbi:nuclear transport factor 2 family protein [Dietzia sp. SLG310A2-38A2]|uniref:nuclear transport factor 2 family protein n=1 Tax=Dietzia sp. SLG310A2-38A2 TaxID=1630643 RepID=UPI0015FB550E|nr:nuclear transport factor 2 family protein [Dietzia sp. SLG310A2-38A2]MBB1031228.1 nuclear transport factor 2 family protein [Dietzia sp. SLG310A2-38A2]